MYAIIRAYDTDEWNSWATLAIAKFDAEYIAKLKARKEAVSTISAMGNPPDRMSWYDSIITFFDHSRCNLEEEHPEVFEVLESIFSEEGCWLFDDVPDVLKETLREESEYDNIPRVDCLYQHWYCRFSSTVLWEGILKNTDTEIRTVDLPLEDVLNNKTIAFDMAALEAARARENER